MRAGTSKGVFLRAQDLPADVERWRRILPKVMGSPDPFGRQLDGLGGGTSTTSKLAVVSPSKRPDIADVDYLFIQGSVTGATLDMTGNCGNILSGVAPFAYEEGMVHRQPDSAKGGDGELSLTLRCLNNDQLIRSSFRVKDGLPVENGDMVIDGVSTKGSPIRLDFLDPAGSMTGRLLPTGSPTDLLAVEGLTEPILVSCVDAANPFVFVRMEDVEPTLVGFESSAHLDKEPLSSKVEAIRRSAAVVMGLAQDTISAAAVKGTPKICLVAPASFAVNGHIMTRSWSMGKPHPALQLSGAVCIAAAAHIPGTIPHELVKGTTGRIPSKLRIDHACGTIEASASVEAVLGTKEVKIASATLFRTARRLFSGEAYYVL